MTIVDNMISALIDRLVDVDPDDLRPTTRMVFDECNHKQPGHIRDGLMRLCKAMSDRYTQHLSQWASMNLTLGQMAGRTASVVVVVVLSGI